ncbi:MAG: trypsin-like peptidase domain-containing protein [Planctomycetes bacterium]|nr:trypsin-like peptidase domain-containing protein [Planctomycetota bacterium]
MRLCVRPSARRLAAVLASVCLTACYHLPPVESVTSPDEHAIAHEVGQCPLCDRYHRCRDQVVRVVTTGADTGPGVVVSASGAVVASARFVAAVDELWVEGRGAARFPVRVVHRNPELGLALLLCSGRPLGVPPIPFEPGEEPARVGTDVFLISHVPGLGWTITPGSVVGRREANEVGPLPMIEADIARSPGNPGGPLLDGEGRLVGLVTERAAAPGAERMVQAIPVGVLKAYLDEVLAAFEHAAGPAPAEPEGAAPPDVVVPRAGEAPPAGETPPEAEGGEGATSGA